MSDSANEDRAQRRAAVRGYVIVGMVSGLVAGLATLTVQSALTPPPLKVATVDVSGIVVGEIERMQQGGMDAAKAEAYAHVWGPLLDKSVQDLADEYGVVLLASPAVAAGAPDLTEVLKERLDHEVKTFQ